ncbi:hypothetical protein JIQ42_02731 [Leishmania sp. Namibia]|uniref:hypothetical protein n=1 Tax=Leishmania sp. Namibia TaxID=2802991 RepID=UPI001B50FECC|nr:hypothetical protein JIQ42_02731 [Leishmania sp. Namibia]
MGASPSREAQDQYLDELRERKQKAWRIERRRKEVSLLPLTKKFMHYVQPDPAARPDSRTPSNSGSQNFNTDTNSSSTSRSSRRDYCPGQLCRDAAPASLPFVQQLYNAYREPGIQFYCRKESWGKMNELPRELYYPTVESFYAATVSCYEEELYETNEEMQQAYDQQKLARQLRAFGSAPKGAAPTQRPKKSIRGPQIRPTPCAICFEYPTSSIAPPPKEGDGTFATANAHRCGAPHGSVVFAPHCSFMVVGFVGMVPVRHDKARACAASFLRPPAESAGNDGEGKCAGTRDEPAEYELVAFISKSAGEQHLGRALFQAAFLYVDQCRRAGLPGNPPLPSTRFSCFLMDVPSLCFLREVRLRCAELQWSRRLARALRRIRVAAHHLAIEMNDTVASEMGAFMAECFVKLDFHPSPTTPACLFAGFVGDAGSAVAVDASAAFPCASIHAAPLPTSASAEVKALLGSRARGDGLFGYSGGAVGSGSRGAAKESAEADSSASAGSGAETVKVVCVVGTNQLTVGSVVYPHATVLERAVQVSTGAFVEAGWAVGQDLSGHEALATDFYEPDPEDEWDYSICVRAPPEREPRPTAVVSDIILSWSKNLYVQARLAETSNSHWVSSYPLDYYTAARLKATPSQTADTNAGPPSQPPLSTATPAAPSGEQGAKDGKARTSPLTASNVKALSRAWPTDSSGQRVANVEDVLDVNATPPVSPEAATRGFYLWEFEHQGRFYTIGLVPNFVRAIRRGWGNAADRSAPNRRNKSPDREKIASAAALASAGGDVITRAVDPMSEADVSSAASQHYENNRSYSGLSSRSGETYRTAGSSHSTMSNLHLVGGRRSVRQRRMMLSLRTGQAYENGVAVSSVIPPVSGGRHSRAMSDTGSSTRNESSADARAGGGADLPSKRFNSDGVAVTVPISCGGNGTFGYLGSGHETDAALGRHAASGGCMPPPHELQQVKRYVNTPYEHSPQQFQPPQALQRRLSGGAGCDLPPKAETRAPFQWQSRLALGDDGAACNGTGSLHGFGPGGYSDGLVDYIGYEVSGETDIFLSESAIRLGARTADVETPPPLKEQMPAQHHNSGGRGVLGPSRALAQGGKGATQAGLAISSAGGVEAMPQPPVLKVTAHVQEVKDTHGRTKLRWDWRSPQKR